MFIDDLLYLCANVAHAVYTFLTQGGRTPLMVASFHGHGDIVRMLIKAKAQIDMHDEV